jgi:hypothetical protein
MPTRKLAELTGIAVTMVAKANMDAYVSDEILAQHILDEADPLFVEELGRALSRQRLVMWIQAERRKAQRRMLARRLGTDKTAG